MKVSLKKKGVKLGDVVSFKFAGSETKGVIWDFAKTKGSFIVIEGSQKKKYTHIVKEELLTKIE